MCPLSSSPHPSPSAHGVAWSPQTGLDALVDLFVNPGAEATPPADTPQAVAVSWLDDEIEVTFIPLGPVDPIEQLATLDAAARWDAFGLVTCGTATSLRGADDLRTRVRVAVLVDRAGRVASAVRSLDRGAPGEDNIDLCEGRVPDGCRRVLGLPTAPPPVEPFTLLTLQWADAVAALGAASPGTTTWSDAHAALPFNPRSTWTELRLGVASGALEIPGITSDLAAFMDDGMFAREALSCSASPRDLFEILSATIGPDVLQRFVDHLEKLADELALR